VRAVINVRCTCIREKSIDHEIEIDVGSGKPSDIGAQSGPSMQVLHGPNGTFSPQYSDIWEDDVVSNLSWSFTRLGTPLVTEAHLPSNQ
jgi:hypothetical protein